MAAIASLPTAPLGTVEVLREMDALVGAIDTGDVQGGAAASAALRDADRVITRLQAVRLSLLAAADRCEVAAEAGLTGTSAWLAAGTRVDGATAARDVKLAAALDNELASTRAALAAGELSTEHAQVIASTAAQLPDGLDHQERAAMEAALVAKAKHVDPTALRKVARRALSAAQRSRAEVDAHEDSVLRTEEDAALAKTRLTWHHNGDGTTSGHFTLPALAASILVKTVQQMASPRRFAQQAAKKARAHGAVTAGQVARGQWQAFGEADGDWANRYGKAFLELVEHLPTDKLTGKVAATVVVTVDLDTIQRGLGAAHLDTGHDISASEARRLACGAGILPAILGGKSVPLDLGRADRFFTEAQRVALATTYDTCAAQHCDRPYAWSELHHEEPWSRGGRTDLNLAVPLCGDHHRRIHDASYTHRIDTDAGGKKCVSYLRRT